MKTVDPLLRLAASQGADELVFRAGEPPSLRGRKGLRALSMPTLDESQVRDALREIVGSDADRAEGDGRYGNVRARWKTTDRLEVAFARVPDGPPARAVEPAPAPAREVAFAPPPVVAQEHAASLARFVAWARAHGASDLVLTDGRPVAARVQGAMIRGDEVVPASGVAALLDFAFDERRRARLATEGSADAALEIDGVRLRVNRFRTLAGESAVLRPVRDDPPTLRSLHLPEAIARFAEQHDGLVLVTGPSGSGKSTTLVAMIEHLHRQQAKHVVTLEDPIEYVFGEGRAVIHQREVGLHVSSFAEGLRAALREAPDVILLGELRDRETIAAAVTAAETGHLVLATLHAGSASSAIDRVVDVFPEHQQRQVRTQLADVLRVVLSQRLFPSRSGGRVPAIEILPNTPAIAHLVREGKTFQIPQTLQIGREQGMVPMARAIADLVRSGAIDRRTALELAPDPQQVLEALR